MKSSFKLIEKKAPKFKYLGTQTLKNRVVQIKLCKENHRVQSKISNVAFSMESRFQIKVCCFVIRLCTFAHSYSTKNFLILNNTRFIAGRSPHSHIQRFFFFFFFFHKHDAHECIYLSIFLSTLLNSCSFLLFHVFLKFFYPFVDINVKNLYILFLRARKTSTKCCNKYEKKRSDII